MSMLAEQRRRTKWVINPTKKPLWTTDSNGIKFGKKLMEKMGWSAGKGLGLNEQGIQEPLKVGFKNDTKGMGFKENLDDWIEHQDEFNILLNQLRSNNDSSAVDDSQDGKIEVTSLEEKSKQSKARVHYQKFTRGKDLSKYSANDLACILGTNKTKKEKPKPEDTTKTESKVNDDYETSFGVTTINSGSIQDYFKKKWITGKSNSFDDDTLEDSADPFNKEKNCSLLDEEQCIKLENGGKKSKKRKHKSSSDSLHVEESQLSNLDETENIRVEKKKKKKKEVLYLQEEHKNNMKNEVSCLDENMPEESESLSLKTEDSSNEVRQIKTDKDQMKLEIVSIEEESKKEIKEKKRKRNVEQCTTEDVFPAEEIHDTNSKDNTLEEESVKRKKKKKNKKKLEENEMFENQCDYQNQGEYSHNYLSENSSEREPIKKKKKKRRELEKLDEANIKDFSSFQYNSSNNQSDSTLSVEKTKKLSDTSEKEDVADVKSKKKKSKKKDIKEKVEVPDFKDSYDDQEVLSNSELDLSVTRKRKLSSKCEGEDTPEVLSGKKKKKRRNEEVEEINGMEIEVHNTNQIEESESGKDVSKEIIFDYQAEDAIKMESVKKKKHNKEKSVELEAKTEECFSKEEKAKVTFEEENTVNAEFIKKKRKKKNKGEKLEASEGIENKNEQSEQSAVVEKTSVGMRNGVIDSKLDVSMNNNSNSNERNDVLNANTKAENRIEKLTPNLFPDKAADKYFPERGVNERVLKLIRWANISEFRGSNLRNVEGYGRQKEYEKQFR